ncbi:MAG TPA: ATP synthase F1 subunit delta [Ktedonobacterales bacterium]|nr:ATP synthase F1 subunit delta [Ktedonobacterales bacterium]
MLTGPVARRYAEAVFEIGVQDNMVDAWLTDVRLIAEYFTNRQLIFILGEPNIRFDRKEAIVRDLLGDKIRPEAMGLALTLVERGLVSLAGRIRDQFEILYNDYRGQAVAQVTSALPLDDASRASITRQLEDITGKHILLQERVDNSLLGGVIARVGDTLIDGSVRRRLELLRRQIAQGGDMGDPLTGFDDLKPLLDLPGGGGVARPLPGSAPTPDGANPGSSGGESNGGGGPSGSLAFASQQEPSARITSRVGAATQPGRRSHDSGANGKRGKGRRR